MGSALKVVLVMLAVPLIFSGLLFVVSAPFALWGALFIAGLLGIVWFHRARRRPVFLPYIIVWVLLFGGMYFAQKSGWCPEYYNAMPGITGGPEGVKSDESSQSFKLPQLFCPFAKPAV